MLLKLKGNLFKREIKEDLKSFNVFVQIVF